MKNNKGTELVDECGRFVLSSYGNLLIVPAEFFFGHLPSLRLVVLSQQSIVPFADAHSRVSLGSVAVFRLKPNHRMKVRIHLHRHVRSEINRAELQRDEI